MHDALNAHVARREALLGRITETLAADARCVAAWLTGSLARKDVDAFSDIDITVVIAEPYSAVLCARPELRGSTTTPERLSLFSQFGQPAVIHENHPNAPEGGTFTFVLYTSSVLMVDWVLLPQAKAQRPVLARPLFERVILPSAPLPELESLERRAKLAGETVAFFWMMAAVTAKYLARHDSVFVVSWLEELQKRVREVERLIRGEVWQYHRGSLSTLQSTPEGQRQALYQLCRQMQRLMPEVVKLGGAVPATPMPIIETLLNLVQET